jgi:hypothetical protein
MATRSEAGVIDINTVFFSLGADLRMYFLSNPAAAHCRNLSYVSQMAVTVFDSHQEWGRPHAGLQLYGTGGLVPPEHAEEARASYAARFTRYFDLVVRGGEAEESAAAVTRLQFYLFRPTRVKVFDEHAFGDDVFITAEISR